MEAGVNKVAISLPSFYNETVRAGSVDLHIDTSFNPTKHQKTDAKIVGLPIKVDEAYEPFLRDLRRSDRVYFDFKALDHMDYVTNARKDKIYFVPIEMVLAASSESAGPDNGQDPASAPQEPKIYPNVGIVLCSPFYGFGFTEIEIAPNHKVIARGKNGLLTDINPKPDDRIAFVEYIGAMRPNVPDQNLSPKDLVFRDSFTNYEYEIAGRKLYVVDIDNINGVLSGSDFSYKANDSVRNEYKYDIDATKQLKEASDAAEWLSKEKKYY